MFIIPFYTNPKAYSDSKFYLTTAWCFMSGSGKTVWEIEDNITKKELIDKYLTPNGIFGEIVLKGSVWLVKISHLTNISEFYSWKDFLVESKKPEAEEIWRPFIWLGDTQPGLEDDWGWDEECKTTSLGKFGSILDLWKILPIEDETRS